MPSGIDVADEEIRLTEAQRKSRRSRSIALAIAIGALVVLMLALTLANGPSMISRPL